jgi:hypothetical protein
MLAQNMGHIEARHREGWNSLRYRFDKNLLSTG